MARKPLSLLVSLVLGGAALLAVPASAAADCADADTLPLLTLFSLPRFELDSLPA